MLIKVSPTMNITPFKLERFFAPYEFSARYMLGSSDCQSMTIGELLSFDLRAVGQFQDHWLGYTESQGSPELRAEIGTLYDHIDPDQILVCSGAEEAIFAFMNSALQPGDHLIVHAPCYQSLYEIARANGCEVTLWMTAEASDWALDLNWLRDNLRENTRAVVVNCPHNPTGYLMGKSTQQELIDILRERGVLLFSDEVYRGLEHDPLDRLPAACDLYENAVSLGVMSKTYGLAGLRIGWLATRNKALYDGMAAFKDYTTICNSAPSEFLSALALRHRNQIVARNLAIIRTNLELLDRFFARQAERFVWQRPSAGPIAFPRFIDETNVEQFCIDLVEKKGVMLVPGECFFYGGSHFRIGFGRENMPEALEQFEEYLQV
jgi:aspartate/methionine/tyrosine aminotransferase